MNRIFAPLGPVLAPVLTAVALLASGPAAAVEMGDDGLHKQPWFSYTFKDLSEDVGTAKESGKRLAIFIEQRGCSYCRKMHEEVYALPEMSKLISENYMVIQINMFGDEDVTDFDGETLPEKDMVKRWGVLFTPTVLFMPETAPEGGTAAAAAVAVMPGAFSKSTAGDMYTWVLEKGYETDEPFQKYHARMIEKRQAGE